MKNLKAVMLLLMMTFGFSSIYAQTTAPVSQTSKPKKQKKQKATDAITVGTPAPATAPASDTPQKPKRKYTKKDAATTTTVTPPPPVAINNPKPQTNNTTYASAPKTKAPKPQKTVYTPTSGGVENNHQILVGPRGGKYYINKNGNKTYVK